MRGKSPVAADIVAFAGSLTAFVRCLRRTGKDFTPAWPGDHSLTDAQAFGYREAAPAPSHEKPGRRSLFPIDLASTPVAVEITP